jgi:hypothetical protein
LVKEKIYPFTGALPMSILSCSPLSPCPEETFFIRETPTFSMLLAPLEAQLPHLTPLVSGSNKPLTYMFAHQMRGLVYFHVEECTSAQDLLSAAENDRFANSVIVPPSGLGKSTFYEALANRGSLQMFQLLDRLSGKAAKIVGISYAELGPLKAIDGSLIDASLSMTWADYRENAPKAKMHLGLDLNQGIPRKMVLTNGNGAERPFVSAFLEKGETGVVDRGYQDHQRFDDWIEEDKHFVARVKKNTQYEIRQHLPFQKGSSIFFFAQVVLGGTAHQMTHPVFLVGFKSRGKVYWVATDRQDLTAEQIAFIFSLRWQIETFFAWWKRHLNVYHLICRNPHGVLIQLLAGLITYLLLVIYFHRRYGEKPSLERLRQLRWNIRHESCAPTKIQLNFFILIFQDNALSNLLFFQLLRHAIL